MLATVQHIRHTQQNQMQDIPGEIDGLIRQDRRLDRIGHPLQPLDVMRGHRLLRKRPAFPAAISGIWLCLPK